MIKNKTVAMSNTDQVTEDVSQLFTSIKLHEGYLCSNSGTNRLQSYLNNGNHSSIKSMRLFDGIDIIEYFTENKFAGDETYCFNMPLRNNTKIQIQLNDLKQALQDILSVEWPVDIVRLPHEEGMLGVIASTDILEGELIGIQFGELKQQELVLKFKREGHIVVIPHSFVDLYTTFVKEYSLEKNSEKKDGLLKRIIRIEPMIKTDPVYQFYFDFDNIPYALYPVIKKQTLIGTGLEMINGATTMGNVNMAKPVNIGVSKNNCHYFIVFCTASKDIKEGEPISDDYIANNQEYASIHGFEARNLNYEDCERI